MHLPIEKMDERRQREHEQSLGGREFLHKMKFSLPICCLELQFKTKKYTYAQCAVEPQVDGRLSVLTLGTWWPEYKEDEDSGRTA